MAIPMDQAAGRWKMTYRMSGINPISGIPGLSHNPDHMLAPLPDSLTGSFPVFGAVMMAKEQLTTENIMDTKLKPRFFARPRRGLSSYRPADDIKPYSSSGSERRKRIMGRSSPPGLVQRCLRKLRNGAAYLDERMEELNASPGYQRILTSVTAAAAALCLLMTLVCLSKSVNHAGRVAGGTREAGAIAGR